MSQSNSSKQLFVHTLLQKIQGSKNKEFYLQLRALNKHYNSYIQKDIICADVKYYNLKALAISNFAPQILNLKLSVPVESIQVDDLCYISTKYFVNIQSIQLRFENPNQNKQCSMKMELKEDLTIRGLSVAKNQHVQALEILGRGKYNLNIFNSKFNGLQIHADANARVEISDVKFMNSLDFGFWARVCTSVEMKDIFAKNCGYGLYIFGCQNFVGSNINVKQCKQCDIGIRSVKNFQIANVKIFHCGQGLEFEQGKFIDISEGKMTDVVVGECSRQGVFIDNVQVRYQRYQGINNNAGNDVVLGGQLDVVLRGQLSAFIEDV